MVAQQVATRRQLSIRRFWVDSSREHSTFVDLTSAWDASFAHCKVEAPQVAARKGPFSMSLGHWSGYSHQSKVWHDASREAVAPQGAWLARPGRRERCFPRPRQAGGLSPLPSADAGASQAGGWAPLPDRPFLGGQGPTRSSSRARSTGPDVPTRGAATRSSLSLPARFNANPEACPPRRPARWTCRGRSLPTLAGAARRSGRRSSRCSGQTTRPSGWAASPAGLTQWGKPMTNCKRLRLSVGV